MAGAITRDRPAEAEAETEAGADAGAEAGVDAAAEADDEDEVSAAADFTYDTNKVSVGKLIHERDTYRGLPVERLSGAQQTLFGFQRKLGEWDTQGRLTMSELSLY